MKEGGSPSRAQGAPPLVSEMPARLGASGDRGFRIALDRPLLHSPPQRRSHLLPHVQKQESLLRPPG